MSFEMSLTGLDKVAVALAVEMGIDARLQAFCDSTFTQKIRGPIITASDGSKKCLAIALDCSVAWHELPILLRRLIEIHGREWSIAQENTELGEEAERLARDILYSLCTEEGEDFPRNDAETHIDAYIEQDLLGDSGGFHQPIRAAVHA